MEKEKVIKISLMVIVLIFIIFIWIITLRYNIQGGFKSSHLADSSKSTVTSTTIELETNIKTTKQQLTNSWTALKNLFKEKSKN